MKYLLLLVVVGIALWMIVPRRRIGRGEVPSPRSPQAGAESMVACAQCGVHLPKGEALPGVGGVFCSDAHRAMYEAAHRR